MFAFFFEATGRVAELLGSLDWSPVIAVATPAVVAGVRRLLPRLPKWTLPILAAVAGVAGQLVAAIATGAEISPISGALLGLAGVGLREVVDQALKAGVQASGE